MVNRNRTSDEGDAVTTLSVFDLNMASAYYACVFDAEIDESAKADLREMKIGERRFLLKLHKSTPLPHDPLCRRSRGCGCLRRAQRHQWRDNR